jgi:hypothetical protein
MMHPDRREIRYSVWVPSPRARAGGRSPGNRPQQDGPEAGHGAS